MRVARLDGVLLKPDRPAVAIDTQWYGDIFKQGRLQSTTGEISETFSTLRVAGAGSDSDGGASIDLRWNFVLGWGIDNSASRDGGYNITAEDIGMRASSNSIGIGPTHLAWPEYLNGKPDYNHLRPFPIVPGELGLPVPKAKGVVYGQYVLWRTAPVICDSWTGSADGGFALLGESSKFISVSSQRIAMLSFDCAHGNTSKTAGLRVVISIVGAPTESVTMTYVPNVSKPSIKDVECQLGPNGKSTLVITVKEDGMDHASCGLN